MHRDADLRIPVERSCVPPPEVCWLVSLGVSSLIAAHRQAMPLSFSLNCETEEAIDETGPRRRAFGDGTDGGVGVIGFGREALCPPPTPNDDAHTQQRNRRSEQIRPRQCYPVHFP